MKTPCSKISKELLGTKGDEAGADEGHTARRQVPQRPARSHRSLAWENVAVENAVHRTEMRHRFLLTANAERKREKGRTPKIVGKGRVEGWWK